MLDGSIVDVSSSTHGSEAPKTMHLLVPSVEDAVARHLIRSGAPYEEAELRLTTLFLEPGCRVVDVGANIGGHTIFWSLICRAQVHAFEPNPLAFAYLEENIRLNGQSSRVTAHHLALGAACGTATLELTTGNMGRTFVRPCSEGPVKIIRLDELRLCDIRLLKVDVEGMEAEVLSGAYGLLQSSRPIVWVEILTEPRLVIVRRMLRELRYTPPLWISSNNVLFFPSWRAVFPRVRGISCSLLLGRRLGASLLRWLVGAERYAGIRRSLASRIADRAEWRRPH